MEPADQSTTDQQTAELTKKVRQLIKASGKRQTAGAELVALGDEAIAILCCLVVIERKHLKRLNRGFSLVSALAWLTFCFSPRPHTTKGYELVFLFTMIAWSCYLCKMYLDEYGRRATRLLMRLEDVRAVGPLLDAMVSHSDDISFISDIRRSLSSLLPRLQASDAKNLLPRHISILNNELTHRRTLWKPRVGTDHILTVLKALEQVGDETSLTAVEKLVHITKSEKVREAAEACLPFLQQRAVLGKHTLLRAASHNTADLLLPAHGAAEPKSDTLLRAVSEGNLAERP